MDGLLDPLIALSPEQYLGLGAGLALLIFGKRLYWLAIAGLGAFLAIWIAHQLGQTLEPETRLVVTGVAGLAGAFFAVMAQKMALQVAGVILGALILGWTSYLICVDVLLREPTFWPLFAAMLGAFIGLLFAQKLFNAALVVVSSAVGAILLTQGLTTAWLWSPSREALAMLLLFVIGLVAQTGRRKAPRVDD